MDIARLNDSDEALVYNSPDESHHLASSYRRPSFVSTYGLGRPSLLASSPQQTILMPEEVEELDFEERALLRESASKGVKTKTYGAIARTHPSPIQEESEVSEVEDNTLLERRSSNERWQDVTSSYRHEFKILMQYSAPLIITFLLQSSEQFSTVFSLGHLGTLQLGASSLSTMMAAITGFSLFQGVITALDTLCAQAYGSGRKELVGLNVQKCLLFLLLLHFPVIVIWTNTEWILLALSQNPELARFSGESLDACFLKPC